MKKHLKLNECFNGFLDGNGIFEYLSAPYPWGDSMTPAILNFHYFGNHSGEKWISPIVNVLLSSKEPIQWRDNALQFLAKTIEEAYYHIWTARYQTYTIEHNILDNYKMSVNGTREEEGADEITYGKSVSGTDSTTFGHVVNDTSTTNFGHIVNDSGSRTDSTYGFNSVDAVPASSGTDTNSTTNSGSDTSTANTTNSGTDSTTKSETNSGKDTSSDTRNESYEETRTGTTGLYTPQKLIQEERALWLQPYLETVFNDIDKILALRVY